MRDSIISDLENPQKLEQLYRENKAAFKSAFESIYTEFRDKPIVRFWHERLNYKNPGFTWGSAKDLIFFMIASTFAGFLAKLPEILSIDEELYYIRNTGYLVFPFLSLYFVWKNKIPISKITGILIMMAVSLVYINLLPYDPRSDTFILACLHLPILLWGGFGISFAGAHINDPGMRLKFLSFNGDLLVMSSMLVLAGILLTGITLGLFQLLEFDIAEFYFRYIVIFCLPAVPILACMLISTNPSLVNKVSPVIAKIFSPLVLIMLVIYLAAIIYSGKDPYTNRDFLIIFNLLLLGVMALIFFSITEGWKENDFRSNRLVLFPLSVITIIINIIALSAIIYRISEWGITPNRLVVLGSNLLILLHLCLVSFKILKCLKNNRPVASIGRAIVSYLPVYIIWSMIVIFLVPFLFNFK